MTDPYTPTTEEVRCAWCDEIARGYASVEPGSPIANLSCGEHGSDFTPDGDLFKSWLAAHDAQVREDAAKAMREAAAVEAESSTNPAGFGHGSLNEGSRSQWYAHGKRDSAAVIRALPIPSTGTDAESDRLADVRKKKIGGVRALRASTGAESTDSDEKEGQR